MNNSISKEITIDVNRKQLWKIISVSGQLHLFHPFCKNNEVLKWDKEKSIDYIEYYNILNTSQKLEIKYPKINLDIIVCFHQDKSQ